MKYIIKSAIKDYIPDCDYEAISPIVCIENILKERGYSAKIEKAEEFNFCNVMIKSLGKRQVISRYVVSEIQKITEKKGLQEYTISIHDDLYDFTGRVPGESGFKGKLKKLKITDGKMYLKHIKDFFVILNDALYNDLVSCGVDKEFVEELRKVYLNPMPVMAINGYYSDIADYYKKFVKEWEKKIHKETYGTPIVTCSNGFFAADIPVLGDNFHICRIKSSREKLKFKFKHHSFQLRSLLCTWPNVGD